MNKYKLVLKGNEQKFKTKVNGDLNYIIASIMQYVCELTIESEITKKEFLEKCKESYEQTLKSMNERESE